MNCPACSATDVALGQDVCPHCGHRFVSDPDATLETLVREQGTVPTLATLFRKAKATGAIPVTVSGYGGKSV